MSERDSPVLLETIGKLSKPSIVFFWLSMLFFVTIVASVLALTASQLQTRLSTLSKENLPLSVWQIERLRLEWRNQKARVAIADSAVEEAHNQVEAATANFEILNSLYAVNLSNFHSATNELVAKLIIIDPELNQFTAAEIDPLIAQSFVGLRKISGSLSSQQPELVPYVDKWEQALGDVKNAAAQRGNLKNAIGVSQEALEVQIESLDKQRQRQELIIDPNYNNAEKALNKQDKARLYDLVSEFEFIEQFAGGLQYKFSILPNDMLVMVLVVAMGILGSTLQLVYGYFQKRNWTMPVNQFFVRPMLGAITAIVVFIFLKAGVLVVTDSAKLGEVPPLNPFFISFVGIVSGFMSDEAVEVIRRVGQSWLKGSTVGVDARWASRVHSVMKVKKKEPADLAKQLMIAESEVTKWLSEEEKVSAENQLIIAAWLNSDARELFTDIPPVKKT